MSGKISILVTCVVTALNVILSAVNVSTRSTAAVLGLTQRGEVARMDYDALRHDYDFRRAVEDIVEDCKVRDGGRISC